MQRLPCHSRSIVFKRYLTALHDGSVCACAVDKYTVREMGSEVGVAMRDGSLSRHEALPDSLLIDASCAKRTVQASLYRLCHRFASFLD